MNPSRTFYLYIHQFTYHHIWLFDLLSAINASSSLAFSFSAFNNKRSHTHRRTTVQPLRGQTGTASRPRSGLGFVFVLQLCTLSSTLLPLWPLRRSASKAPLKHRQRISIHKLHRDREKEEKTLELISLHLSIISPHLSEQTLPTSSSSDQTPVCCPALNQTHSDPPPSQSTLGS